MNSARYLASTTPGELTVAVIGLGLMGSSISTCLLAAGHSVIGIDNRASARERLASTVEEQLLEMVGRGLLDDTYPALARLRVTDSLAELGHCGLVVETITEDLEAKRRLFAELDQVLSPSAVIASNTSALPISLLQEGTAHPGRILGMHWAEPAHTTRFLEVVCGRETDMAAAEAALALSRSWGKEPALVRRDIRGFIANRIMYAILREAFFLVESGVAGVEDIDRCISQDLGSWTALDGPFRYMDLTGLPAYATVMQDLFPDLSNRSTPPPMMQELVRDGAGGIENGKGFYSYTPETAARWRTLFQNFSYEIRQLADKYREQIRNLEESGQTGGTGDPAAAGAPDPDPNEA